MSSTKTRGASTSQRSVPLADGALALFCNWPSFRKVKGN
jgi:hypothetical protein